VIALIDEIDKADFDLPNALLECLGNGEFHLPYRDKSVCCCAAHGVPLVVITTNRERQLPPAFVRRCLVLELSLPAPDKLVPWLTIRGQAHFRGKCPPAILEQVARDIAQRRDKQSGGEHPRPGLAEYLDLLRVLANHAPGDEAAQRGMIEHVARFVYDKHAAYEV
jgi:MoxR-like ATPase